MCILHTTHANLLPAAASSKQTCIEGHHLIQAVKHSVLFTSALWNPSFKWTIKWIFSNSFCFCGSSEKHSLSSFGFHKSYLEISYSVETSFTSSSIIWLLFSSSENFSIAEVQRTSSWPTGPRNLDAFWDAFLLALSAVVPCKFRHCKSLYNLTLLH